MFRAFTQVNVALEDVMVGKSQRAWLTAVSTRTTRYIVCSVDTNQSELWPLSLLWR